MRGARRSRARLPVRVVGCDDPVRDVVARRGVSRRGARGDLRQARPAHQRRVLADRYRGAQERRLRRERPLGLQHGRPRRRVDRDQRRSRGERHIPECRTAASCGPASSSGSTIGTRAAWPRPGAAPWSRRIVRAGAPCAAAAGARRSALSAAPQLRESVFQLSARDRAHRERRGHAGRNRARRARAVSRQATGTRDHLHDVREQDRGARHASAGGRGGARDRFVRRAHAARVRASRRLARCADETRTDQGARARRRRDALRARAPSTRCSMRAARPRSRRASRSSASSATCRRSRTTRSCIRRRTTSSTAACSAGSNRIRFSY